MGRARKTAPKIWPGPECLVTPERVLAALLWAGQREEAERYAAVVRARCAKAERRTLDIALARTKARARMERFLAWLDSRHAPRSLVAYVGKHLSPEVAVSSMMRADVRHYLCSVFACMGANIIRTPCPGCQPVLAASLLASPEWASLPWQADPETP